MKTQTHITTRFADSVPVPLEIPISTVPRPARRGEFWPGESFGSCTRKWDLAGVFASNAFVLPAIIGGNGSRTH